jgi:ATP-dependent Clp protease adaptor protein ClpS
MRQEVSPGQAEPEVVSDLEWVVVEETGGMARVIIHNDDITPMEFVVLVLRQIFGLSPGEAERVMLRAHYTGLAHVITLPMEEAKHRVGRAHAIARQASYPLSFTIEPEKQ